MGQLMRRRVLWGLIVALGLAALAWPGPQAARVDATDRVHPAVEVYGQQNPGAQVPVIVQMGEGARQAASQLARSLGASRELALIAGFAANLSPAEIERLARNPDVEMISLDAVMTASDGPQGEVDASDLATAYPFAANAVAAWDEGIGGDDVTVAVIDSGISGGSDFGSRLTGRFSFSGQGPGDKNGHGTHVAGVIAGYGKEYVGIAPEARLLSLKVADKEGAAQASDVIEALQWAVDHRDEYGIDVINISLTSSVAGSYRLDPLDAAVEQAWFHGIVVVVAAGNYGSDAFAVDHAPANDPFVITVGAFDDAGTAATADDTAVGWSSRGWTVDGRAKPEVTAPGVGIVSTLSDNGSFLARGHPEAVVDSRYIRLSGTSASAAVVSGVVALMLEQDPDLTPDEVKFRLMQSAQPLDGSQAPRVDAQAAVFAAGSGEANQDAPPSDLVDPVTGEIMYDSVLWRSVLWRSVLWRSLVWSQ